MFEQLSPDKQSIAQTYATTNNTNVATAIKNLFGISSPMQSSASSTAKPTTNPSEKTPSRAGTPNSALSRFSPGQSHKSQRKTSTPPRSASAEQRASQLATPSDHSQRKMGQGAFKGSGTEPDPSHQHSGHSPPSSAGSPAAGSLGRPQTPARDRSQRDTISNSQSPTLDIGGLPFGGPKTPSPNGSKPSSQPEHSAGAEDQVQSADGNTTSQNDANRKRKRTTPEAEEQFENEQSSGLPESQEPQQPQQVPLRRSNRVSRPSTRYSSEANQSNISKRGTPKSKSKVSHKDVKNKVVGSRVSKPKHASTSSASTKRKAAPKKASASRSAQAASNARQAPPSQPQVRPPPAPVHSAPPNWDANSRDGEPISLRSRGPVNAYRGTRAPSPRTQTNTAYDELEAAERAARQNTTAHRRALTANRAQNPGPSRSSSSGVTKKGQKKGKRGGSNRKK